MATPAIAAGAYARLARLSDPSAGLAKVAGEAAGQGPSFGSILQDVVGAVSAAGGNKANLVDVVTAVAETETAITTLVSVRDKVIAAYEEIMRMPI